MGRIHAISIREKSLRSELLLPFTRAGTVRLSGAAARLATLLRGAGACSAHRTAQVRRGAVAAAPCSVRRAVAVVGLHPVHLAAHAASRQARRGAVAAAPC